MTRYFKQPVLANQGFGMRAKYDDQYVAMMFLEKWYHPLAIDDDYVLTTTALSTVTAGSDPTITLGTLDFPRNVTVVASAAATSEVVVTGTRDGEAVHEHLTLNGTSTVTGSQIFDEVTAVHLAVRIDGAANVKVGIGNKLGLSRTPISFLPEGLVDEVVEGTLPTLDKTNGSIAFNTALAASKTYVAKYWSSEHK